MRELPPSVLKAAPTIPTLLEIGTLAPLDGAILVEGVSLPGHPFRCLLHRMAEIVQDARYGEKDDVVRALESGVDVMSRDEHGNTALHMAAANGHVEIVSFLLSRGAKVNDVNENGNTPLHWAALNGQAAAAEVLLKAGALGTIKNKYDRTPYGEAATRGYEDLAVSILKLGDFPEDEAQPQEADADE